MDCGQILTKDHAESLNSESPKSLEKKVTVTYGRLLTRQNRRTILGKKNPIFVGIVARVDIVARR